MKIAVGSKNPVKINAVQEAFKKVFPSDVIEVEGIEVDSEVSKQPMSDDESIRGARNRAQKSIDLLNADYGVGLEGGLQEISGMWFDCGWMVIVDTNGREGIGSSIRMHTPTKMIMLVEQGNELGEACDILFKTENSKQEIGQFGLMTNSAVTRTSAYIDGVIAALASFVHPELF